MSPCLVYILYTLGPSFVCNIIYLVTKKGIKLNTSFQIDHICYRTATQEEYISCKRELDEMGSLLIESIVGGRPISCYKLKTPIVCSNGALIDVVELPSPKQGSPYVSGLEHIEFVCDVSLEVFVYLRVFIF
jgi:predicted metalloenzyme YecM